MVLEIQTLTPIGVVHSPFKQKFGTPRQSGLTPSALGEILLNPKQVAGGCLEGLEQYSHLWIIFSFHKNVQKKKLGKILPPRLEGKKMGLFATRSPHRPHPMGLSLVKIDHVDQEKLRIKISGLDLVHGTPVLDIKPYIGFYDYPQEQAHWPTFINKDKLQVHWTENALLQIQNLKPQSLKELIDETFCWDHRNRKDKKGLDSDKIHRAQIHQVDVVYRYVDQQVLILDLLDLSQTTE